MTDSFHVIKNINDALRNFRIRIMNKYERTSKEYYLLKHYTQLVAMNINEFKDVVSLLQNWKKEIKNSFITINGRRISNGPIESINSKIKIILKTYLKYKNFPRLESCTA